MQVVGSILNEIFESVNETFKPSFSLVNLDFCLSSCSSIIFISSK